MPHNRARREIIDYLIRNGSLQDQAGRTTAKLRRAVSYRGTSASFAQLIAAMERSGDIRREVRGKRTFSISAVQNSPSPESSILPVNSTDGDDYDYDELAASLLVKVVDVLSGKDSSNANSSWPHRRLLAFERRYSQLERELTAANAQIRRISDERDQLRRRLEQAEQNISILQDGIATSRPQAGGAMERLKLEDRALLTQLRRNPSTIGLGDRVGAASSAES